MSFRWVRLSPPPMPISCACFGAVTSQVGAAAGERESGGGFCRKYVQRYGIQRCIGRRDVFDPGNPRSTLEAEHAFAEVQAESHFG